jgi:hypothetical protein
MRYEINDNVVTFYLDNPKRAEEAARSQSFAGTGLSVQQITPLLDCLLKKYRGKAPATQEVASSGFLRPLFAFFQTTGSSWPTTSTNWQLFVFRFFQFYLTDMGWSSARAVHRIRAWQTKIGGLLEFMKDEEIISRDVVIPKVENKKIQSNAEDQLLLGQPRTILSDIRVPPQKLLVDISFGMTDPDYLEVIEKKCRQLVGTIREVCLTHWDGLMKDGETGRQLAAKVSDADIDEAIRTGQYRGPTKKNGGKSPYVTSPTLPLGHNWALAVVRHSLANTSSISCISAKTLRASPFFPNSLFTSNLATTSYTALNSLTAMSQEQWQVLTLPARFYRFAGLLSNLDVAAASCLLVIEHPEFTSESLQGAKLLDVRGKPYLRLTDNSEYSIFSLDKPRAGKRKSVVLTPLAQKLVIDIIRWTASAREVLRRAGDSTWRYLFLGVTQRNNATGTLGIVEGKLNYVHGGKNSIGLTTLYQALSMNELTKGTFDYRRLRNTMGVIRWFETGSIVEMSRRLGNTRKVALEHYFPPAMLHAWNTRIIRRFQNTLIVLAAHDEPYLLEVTDFSSMADLLHFIAQLILDYPARTSPFADEVQMRLASDQQRAEMSSAAQTGLLNIRLSSKSLGLLYSYRDLALKTLSLEELNKIDVLSGFAPRQFTDMASLLQHAAESETIHPALSETLDVPLLKQVHCEALAIQVALDAQFAKLAIKHCWTDSP